MFKLNISLIVGGMVIQQVAALLPPARVTIFVKFSHILTMPVWVSGFSGFLPPP